MINILPNNQCKMINIVWIERGILLTIIYYIIKKFDEIKKKNIIIDNLRYIHFLKILFPTLTFSKFNKHKTANFYFNIRNIIKKQDIIIDYLDNYDDIIKTKKISLIPWFDMNDILITFEYNKNKNMHCYKIKKFIKEFSYCKRGNYNNQIWDSYIENCIFKKIAIFNRNININIFINYFNNFIKSNYTNTIIEKPRIYYIEKPVIYHPQSNNPVINTQVTNNQLSNNQLLNNPVINIPVTNNPMPNKPNQKLYCEYDSKLYNQINKIFFGKKILELLPSREIINKKIYALQQHIIILEEYNKIHNMSRINNILKESNDQLVELLNIQDGINEIPKLKELLNKLSSKNSS
jgi:hypothetical protein